MVYFAETAWKRVEKVWVLPRRRVRWLKTEPNFASLVRFFLFDTSCINSPQNI